MILKMFEAKKSGCNRHLFLRLTLSSLALALMTLQIGDIYILAQKETHFAAVAIPHLIFFCANSYLLRAASLSDWTTGPPIWEFRIWASIYQAFLFIDLILVFVSGRAGLSEPIFHSPVKPQKPSLISLPTSCPLNQPLATCWRLAAVVWGS